MSNRAEATLSLAVGGLRDIAGGRTLSEVADAFRDVTGGSSATDILFKYFRCKSGIDRIVSATLSAAGVSKVPGRTRRVLSVVFTQVFFQDGIAPESAANVAVGFIKRKAGARASGFLNTILRRAFESGVVSGSAPKSAVPELPRRRWEIRGGGFAELARNSGVLLSSPPPLTFTASSAVSDSDLAALGCEELVVPGLTEDFRFFSSPEGARVFATDWISRGWVQIRDPSTVLFMVLLARVGCEDWRDGVVLDLCSAPGGKALILAERMRSGGFLVAADASERRLSRVSENFSRREFRTRVGLSVATALRPPFPRESADLVLLDVPCSNTGVFRRRPDAIWRFSEDSLASVVELQSRILSRSAELVVPGGLLVYSTCSLENEENESGISKFLTGDGRFELLCQQTLLPGISSDGGYAAVLRRRS